MPITQIHKTGSSLLAADDNGVSFISAGRLVKSPLHCKGGNSPITSIVPDVLQPQHLFVGFASGDVIAYNSKGGRDKQAGACIKLYKLPTTGGGLPVALHATRGYVIATSAESLKVFNTTGMRDTGVRYVTSKAIKSTSPPLVSVSWVHGSKLPEVMVAVTETTDSEGEDSGSSVSFFEARLPYAPPVSNIGWMRMPVLIGGLVIVFGYQFMMKKGKRKGGRGGRFGGDDMGDDPLAGLDMSQFKSSGRYKPGRY